MRQHKLSLCNEHYSEWFVAQTERSIDKYKMFSPEDRILVAVSGGKDSLALWDVLLRLGYNADGLYIGLGINDPAPYSDQSLEKTRAFVANGKWRVTSDEDKSPLNPPLLRGAGGIGFTPQLHVVDIQDTYGKTIPQMAREKARGQSKPCSVCGLTKRYVMNRIAADKGYNVLATGHNLDDEAAVLMQNTLRWQTGYLARQSAVLLSTNPHFAKKVKPFCRFYERETATYSLVRSIDYVYDECPHAVGNLTNFYKTLLNQLEAQSPGAKLSFYLEFLRARGEGAFDQFNRIDELHECETCGQPTSSPGSCAFCRMWDVQKLASAVVS